MCGSHKLIKICVYIIKPTKNDNGATTKPLNVFWRSNQIPDTHCLFKYQAYWMNIFFGNLIGDGHENKIINTFLNWEKVKIKKSNTRIV